MATFFRVTLGLVAAMLTAAVTVVLFALPSPDPAGTEHAALTRGLGDTIVLVLHAATHVTLFSVWFAIPVIVVGEWFRQRDWTYYTLAGIVIALGGFVAQYAAENASQPTIANNYALIAFAMAGAIGAFFYWMVAGHNAGARVVDGLRKGGTNSEQGGENADIHRARDTAASNIEGISSTDNRATERRTPGPVKDATPPRRFSTVPEVAPQRLKLVPKISLRVPESGPPGQDQT